MRHGVPGDRLTLDLQNLNYTVVGILPVQNRVLRQMMLRVKVEVVVVDVVVQMVIDDVLDVVPV